MVWEQHVLVIVMTTRVLERGRVKCAQYWPEEEISEELIFAQFRITNFSVEKFNDYTITGLQITNLEVRNEIFGWIVFQPIYKDFMASKC